MSDEPWREKVLYDDDGVHLDMVMRWRFVNTHVIEFKIWNAAIELPDTTIYRDEKADEWVKDPDAALPFVEGNLKWDGCSNIRFPGQDSAMLHFCYGNKLAEIEEAIYSLGPEMDAWDFRDDA